MLSNFILLIETFQALNGLLGKDAFHHWSVFLVVGSEISNVFDQNFDVFLQSLQVLSLFNSQSSIDFF